MFQLNQDGNLKRHSDVTLQKYVYNDRKTMLLINIKWFICSWIKGRRNKEDCMSRPQNRSS